MRIRFCFVFALILFLFSFSKSAPCEDKPLWELGIGAALLQIPDYRGSDENRLYVLPYPYFVYRGDMFKVDRQTISGKIFNTDRIVLDVSIFGSVPVKSDNNSARTGMPDLDPTFEVGPALKFTLLSSTENHFNLSLSFPVRAFFSTDFSSMRHEGWVFSPRIIFEKEDIIPKTGLNLGVSAGPMFADSSYNDYYYTVEPAYARSTRPAYSAGGGYSGSTLTMGLSKSYQQFIFHAFVSADFLYGAVFEDSPLVKNKTSIMSGVNISWIFLKSAKTATSSK
jgi:MipA family protein